MILDERKGGGDQSGESPTISVVVPAFNEVGNIRQLYREVRDSLEELPHGWEIIFSDDGSADGTWETVAALNAEDPRVRGVRLSRNFGHQYALLAGLVHSRGQAVISLDADLQHPPSLIPTLIEEWRKGSKIVHTVRLDTDQQSVFKKTSSRLFYRLYSALSGVNIDPGMADFRLLDRQVLDALLQFNEGGLFLRGLVQWVGFPSARVPFRCRERYSGSTKYSVKKMVKLAWAAVTSFSLVPLRIAVVLGVITAFVSFGFLVYAVGSRIFLETHVVPGWASAVSVISLLFGVLFVLLGVIGEYIGKILMEVKRRPRFMVQDGIGLAAPSRDGPPRDPHGPVTPDLGQRVLRTDRALLR